MITTIFRDQAPDLWAAGLPVIPLRPRSKSPCIKEWTRHCHTMPSHDVQALWVDQFPEGNVGLPLGPASGLVVLDIDGAPLAVVFELFAREGLKAAWKRVGQKGAALLFKYEGQPTQRFRTPDGAVSFELLSAGSQVVLPPSIHPATGLPYEADTNITEALKEAPRLPSGFLERLANAVGASTGPGRVNAALPDIEVIVVGGRDTAMTQKAGEFARAVADGRMTMSEAECQLRCWFDEKIDQPESDLLDYAKYQTQLGTFFLRDCVQRDTKGEPIFIDSVPMRCAPYGWDDALTPGDFHALGIYGAKIEVGSAVPAIARDFIFVSQSREFIHNDTGEVFSSDHIVGKFAPYLEGRRYEDKLMTVIESRDLKRVDYTRVKPEKPSGIVREEPYQVFNLYRGYSVSPSQSVSDVEIAPFLELTRLQVPDPDQRNYLLDWEAHLLQHPGQVMTTCPLLYSWEHGTGKNQRVEAIGSLFHPHHFRPITTNTLESQFNAWRDSCLLAFVDEVESSNRAETNRIIKTIVANTAYERNQKHEATRTETNITNLYLATNKPDALRIDQADRRFFIVEIDQAHAAKLKSEFDFAAFRAWRQVNRHKLLGWYLQRDISTFNAYSAAPLTPAKARMTGMAKPTWEAMLDQELKSRSGRFFKDIVCISEVMHHLNLVYKEKPTEGHVREWLRRNGGKALNRRRFSYTVVHRPSLTPEVKKVQTSPWIIRNHRRWQSATVDAVSLEAGRASA